MKQPGLDGRHGDLSRPVGEGRKEAGLGNRHRDVNPIGSKPKVSSEKLARAFDSASKSTGAFTIKRAR